MSHPDAPRPAAALPHDLPACLHEEVTRLLERHAESCATAGLAPRAGEDLVRAFALSPFIAEYAIRQPARFDALVAAADLDQARSRTAYDAAVAAALAASADIPAAKRALRELRGQEMVRIAWRDIVGGAAVETIMAELSDFADAVIAGAVGWLHGQLEARFGRALGTDGTPLELLVLGMGKLGGHELNFSSDIDLIFVYGQGGETVGGRRELPHQEYFDRLGRELIALLNETTADGQVFRVDMRLRPFGDGGPLSSALAALEHYYAVHGRDWERYALIKARAISGDAATRAQFAAVVQPFVFRRYLDYGALDALREMKALINQEATSQELRGDVKRGAGGIREIEFTGQLFQLTRGGREPRLRERSIIATLEACAELGLLETAEVETLVAAYRFLRVTEHRLQEVRDRQTHALPEDEAGRARLAWAFGHADWDAFLAELDGHREATRRLFAQLLEAPEDAADGSAERLRRWRSLWQNAADGAALAAGAEALGHAVSTAGLEVMAELKSERFVSRLSRQGQERLDRLMPVLLEAALTRGLSDASMRRVGELLHGIARRSVYMAFLADHPDAVRRLLELFEASPWIAEQIIAWPLLLDELLDPRALFAPPDRERLQELSLAQVRPADGLEQAMDQLRAFRNQQVLRVAASDVTGHLAVARVSDQLTFIAEACVVRALDMAWGDLTARCGVPRCRDAGGERDAGFAVIGYGKFGGWELGYGSDLDLVFVHDSVGEAQHTAGPKVVENDVFFARLAQRFIHVLSTTTGAGIAYEVDTRLRPSGNAGLMASPIEAYAGYLAEQAWTWELQALVRARAITGNPALMTRFGEVRAAALARPRDAAAVARDIVDMRTRMRGELDRGDDRRFDLKQGSGGITDIEFVVQYAVLRWAAAHPRLLTWTDNLRLLEIIAELGLMPADDCRCLHDAYFAYRADIHRCALQQQDALVEAGKFRDHRDHVIDIWTRVFA
ncbi:MAG: bifunctional [glutamate--ammonia ligase]-adenylyl-L-tyrosine phosphorylase/[glutamate--ammonia-ligase] adenylyltransferase [Gammaproteobacteria bacterium]|nr:bifunctional [glutamate--ammonia ligase]-adenylyl-L-tyrosine phosphorylase/[glutamate--ammonia-ligase] adenylyltransferase [Gammaproteobacteria bacterium]